VHDALVTGRFLAVCGWLADLAIRPLRGTPLRRLGRAPAVVLGILLLSLAVLPIALPLLEPQPENVGVQAIFDRAVTEPDGWIRVRGRLVSLEGSPTPDHAGPFALFIDADAPLRSIVVAPRADAHESTVLTGRLRPATVVVEEELPIEATVAGTPPRVVPDQLLVADPVATPVREALWPLAIPPALLGILVLIGARAGYPVFRRTVEIDVLAAPLAAGERLPAAYGGRIGPHRRDLRDPGGVLLVVRRGPTGSLLTAQPLPDDGGPAPQPVTIGGGWSSSRLGYVFAVNESVPALVMRAELVEATFLFARVSERDRVAALIGVER
jgi:hypothetical protein